MGFIVIAWYHKKTAISFHHSVNENKENQQLCFHTREDAQAFIGLLESYEYLKSNAYTFTIQAV
ncbi:hypothetical protein [Thalassobacillus devorans]|uniref:hypothetical protein n=1 Tax=Thalassobacillus devorans TaxID=279813 RepID=UPI000A1CE455|nr:hypothetical protein [Thalassobacillus devorans]